MNTKDLILAEALKLFSAKGYDSVTVAMIAENCSIKAPSLYKHYKSKREIFDAVYEKALNKYDSFITSIKINEDEITSLNSDILFSKLKAVIRFFTHDEEIVMLRKLMKLSNDSNIRAAYSERFFDFVINYHKRLFDKLIKEQLMIAEDSLSLAMLYDSPLLVIIDELDRNPEREEELLERLKAHSQLFFKLVTKKR
ncbi:TetR/AcrR family transcriptional regulator [Bullifex porci]|uniref:TetR/AcrR family transcriptional regulator n=2 Tax=Bullifex porci TaxID=2606638 RepID=UPI0023F1B184|nr:TetR/AcrR family transcriptional regulator [Bullifex porci]MDD7256375.1 TetR/AcrR family transcriptional regulator [Bullifex porci]MDY2742128.1 TetR/AcrR family transcriptional regulator [Bullifex porci]